MDNIMKNLTITFVALTLIGCARFKTVQTDISYDKGQPSRTITTKATSTTFFDSKSALASFKANQTDKSQGASVGSLNQEANGTNTVAVVEALAHLVGALPK